LSRIDKLNAVIVPVFKG